MKQARIGIVGTGSVGASVAVSVLHEGIARELRLVDARPQTAEGEAMDLAHGSSFLPNTAIRAARIEDMRECDAVVIAAGRGGRADESRLQLLRDNAEVARTVGGALRGCAGVVVVVTNPVDVMTRLVREASGLPRERVIGTGTMLDTARLRHAIGGALGLDPRSVHAQVIGEHGDSAVPLWSSAQVGGRPLREWPGWGRDGEIALAESVRQAAYEIIRRKGATNHAIGLVAARLLRWMLREGRRVVTVSREHERIGKIENVPLSLPTIVGRGGATEVVWPGMDESEKQALEKSAVVIDEALKIAQ